jgi:hypothetical protein
MTTHRNLAAASLSLLLVLVAIPALAAGGARRCATGATGGAPLAAPAFVFASESTEGSCTATCGDMGGTATVSCTGTCTIVDQDCDSGARGYVYCNTTGARADCTACSWCSAETPCPEGGSVSCGMWGDDCIGGSGLCFAKCGNQTYFCPGHFGQIACW